MKIHLIKSQESLIKGYTPVLYSNLLRLNNLTNISDNQCDFILASDLLDEFSIQEIPEIVQSLIKKLRINGTLVVGGTDLRVFCKNVVNSQLNELQAAEMIKSKQSMTSLQETLNLVQNLGLKIQSSQIVGNHYEVTAVRN